MRPGMLVLVIGIILCGSVTRAQSVSPTPNSAQEQRTGVKQTAAQPAARPAGRKEEDCGCEAKKTVTDLAATVNGVKITAKEIDDPIKDEKARLQKQVVEARRRELDLQINSRLLEAEAKKKGVTASKLIEQEILARVKEPTESEAQAFYDENRERIPGEFKDFKQRITDYLKAQSQEQAAKQYADKLREAADIRILVQKVTPPEKESDRETVLATINGEKTTSADVEDALKPLIYDVQLRVHQLRKSELELRINDILLEQEAQKRKITTGALVEADLVPKVKKVTEQEAKKFYEENKETITGDYAQSKDQIIDYLQKKEQRRAEIGFAEQLRQGAKIEINLKEPESPVFQIATGDQPSKGRTDAPVTIVEFTDFECSSCQQSQPVLEKLAEEYSDRVRLVVRDYPLEKHKNAFKAAEAAEAAREQGKYWEYSALLFANQKELGPEKLKEYASAVGLDRKKFDAELDGSKFVPKVQLDMQEAMRLGVNATPTVFINGRRVSDRTYESLKAAIEEVLKAIARKQGNGA